MTDPRASAEPRTGLLETDAAPALELRRVVVRVVAGADRGEERHLEAGTLLVGSHPDNDLALRDGTVSRYHAELSLLPQGVRVRDLGSRNGTFLGETRVDSVLVVPGAELRLGQTRLQIVAADLTATAPPSERRSFGGLSGKSQAMRQVFALLERLAPTASSILFEGEPGTGKTTAARAVHEASGRRGPLVVLDAGAPVVPDVATLATSARGGSLLVERAELLGSPQQVALLSALDAHERGALDVRFLATASADLQAQVAQGRLRRELYFHLSGARVVLPPLASRKEDIPLLVRRLLAAADVSDAVLDKDVLAALYAHSWPGNVRELKQLVTSGLDLRARAPEDEGSSGAVEPASEAPVSGLSFKEAKNRLLARFERAYLVELLERHGGNVSHAALEAGLDRNYLARLARRHGIRI